MDLQKLIKKVNNHFECDITENTRQREVVMARGAYFWLSKQTTNKSLKKIGESVNRDHASVIYSLRNFNDWLRFDEFFNASFESLKINLLNEYNKNNMNAETLLYRYNCLLIENDILKNELKKLKSKT
jgi:chromosomal replication initiation ATPase DnaA